MLARVHSELRRAQALVQRTHPAPIDPQFCVWGADSEWRIAITLTENAKERVRRLGLVSDFMACHTATGFVLASEIHAPDALVAIGIFHQAYAGFITTITRQPFAFAATKALLRENVDPAMLGLLPRGSRTITKARLKQLTEWFGPEGKFPAVPIGNEPESD